MKRSSNKRLMQLIRKALLAIEDPEKNILLVDFDLRYRELEAKRDADSARWFYRDKTPFETKYGEDCEDDDTKPSGKTSDWSRRRKSALEYVRSRLPHALDTLKLIIRNIDNRKESICPLVKLQLSTRRNGNSRGKSTTATLATSPGSSPTGS